VISGAFVVMNPASAGGRTLRRWPATLDALRSAGVDGEVHRTGARGDATPAVRAALERGYRTVVAVGGDGTINEVVNGFFDEAGAPIGANAVLGLLPSGTGGDFRKAAGIPGGIAAAARLIARGSRRRVDVGCVAFADGRRRFFLNIADCGIGGEVVARTSRRRSTRGRAFGSAMFLSASLATLLRFGARSAHIEVDGTALQRTVRSVVVANGTCFGGGMRVAPHAELDDGQFDVVIIGDTGRMRALAGIPSLYRGRHLQRSEVEVHRGRTVHVSCDGDPMLFDIDGEAVGTTPATLTCLPGAIMLCAVEVAGGR
jgi:diacylglycerol kinase (ATP)